MKRELPSAGQWDAERGAYWTYVLHLWTLSGIAISNVFLLATSCLSPWAARRNPIEWRRLAAVLVPVTLYIAAVIASVVGSYRPAASLVEARELLSLATLVLGLLLLRDEGRIRLALNGFVVVSALFALYGLGQLLVGYGDLGHRIRGPFSHYMTFAGVLMMADLLLICQLVSGRLRRVWRWAAFVLINLALVGTLTRSAWVGFIVVLTIVILLRAPKLIVAYVPAALLFLWLAPATVVSRMASTFDLQHVTNYDRLCMAEAGMRMVAQRPLFGLGPGMVEVLYPIYRHPSAPQQTIPHLHNTMLQIAAEKGLIAVAAYVWLMGGALLFTFRRYRAAYEAGDERAELYLGVFAALLAFNLAGLFEDNWRDTEVQRVALFLLAVPYCLELVPSRDAEARGKMSSLAS